MNRPILAILALSLTGPAFADLGVNFPVATDSVNEFNAKSGANDLGISQIYDHPTDVPQGQMYVPIEYNRAGDPGAGEQDPNTPHNTSDIDYVPLSQLKGAVGPTGAQGTQGSVGSQGVQGLKGDQGAKGDKGDPGDDMNNRLTLNIGASVRWYDWKYISLNSGYRYDVRHFGHTVDMAVIQLKLGKSYEDRKLEKLQLQLNQLQQKMAENYALIDFRDQIKK